MTTCLFCREYFRHGGSEIFCYSFGKDVGNDRNGGALAFIARMRVQCVTFVDFLCSCAKSLFGTRTVSFVIPVSDKNQGRLE